MRAHRGRVDAGVGASGGVDADRLAGDPFEGFLERLLDARPVELALPAEKRAAVIFDRQRETCHRSAD